MKKRLKLSVMTVFLAMLLGFAVMFIGTEQAFAMEGDGTAENPYKIATYADLKEFANIVNGTNGATQNTAACAVLTQDITCGDEVWLPIGTRDKPFTGTFDGDGYIIKNLSNKESETAKYQGLFGYIGNSGIVQNVGLEEAYIQGEGYIGAIAGKNNGTITNCFNTGDVSGNYDVGGVAGNNDAGTITNCYNTGAVSGDGSTSFGGVVGYNKGGTIENCYNTGAVSGVGNAYHVGGVVGIIEEGGTITNCYNTGDVTGSSYVGGVAGFNEVSGTITNCYNTGDVSGSGNFVGGVAGINRKGTITNCYNTGDVSGSGNFVGGVAGLNDATITNCYYDKDLCTVTKAIGNADDTDKVKGLTTEQMTGTGALNNMVFVYGIGETRPWMVKESDQTANYYPHLTGFNFDEDGAQMKPADILAYKWPPRIDLIVAPPVFSPASCEFGPEKRIKISSATRKATIYYTTDGTDPTASSNKYTEPITITDTTTIKAIAVKDGADDSEIASATYTHVHTWSPEWSSDGDNHWHECSACGAKKDEVAHTWNTEWSTDGDKHWHNCTVCGEKKDETAHSGGTATCKEKAKCETCNKEYGNLGQHKYGAWTKLNATQHQKVCQHDKSHVVKENHKWDAGKVTKKATEKATGIKTYTCTVCNATKTETIPKLKAKVSGTPTAKTTAKGKTGLTIGWAKIKGADGYDIFFALCNHGGKEMACKKVKTIKGNKTFTWTKSGLKKGTAYKAYVKAYVMKNGKKSYVRTSPMMHALTGGSDKNYTNAKSVTVNKTKVSLKKGKTFKVKAKVNKLKKNKKLMPKNHAPTLRYMTTNKKVATVNSSGKITAKGKGTCVIYVYAHNGVSKQVKVTVK